MDFGWRAEGIARARAIGGVDLEVYRRPGFTGDLAVRVLTRDLSTSHGIWLDSEPPDEDGDDARRVGVGRSSGPPPI
jgi:hypothetical protein